MGLYQDMPFGKALLKSEVLLPDGISIVLAKWFLNSVHLKKIAGADLFVFEMQRLNSIKGKCFFLGSSITILQQIKTKAAIDYPNVAVHYFSPPYAAKFSSQDNEQMLEQINAIKPDVLFVGMTAPKQEIWAYQHKDSLQVGHICCIGAVFDFYAGTVKRAPQWLISLGLEWLYRLVKEPKRLWKRYLIGNTKFVYYILKEKLHT
jgi:N-acetylglucosaminyldiphosphoundecaprenol N-acetyl-beta-D-mannosaminyltransferase